MIERRVDNFSPSTWNICFHLNNRTQWALQWNQMIVCPSGHRIGSYQLRILTDGMKVLPVPIQMSLELIDQSIYEYYESYGSEGIKAGGLRLQVFNNSIPINQRCVHSHLLITTTMSSSFNTDDVKQWVVRLTTFAYHLCLYAGNSKFCKRLNNLVDPPDILKTQKLSKLLSPWVD